MASQITAHSGFSPRSTSDIGIENIVQDGYAARRAMSNNQYFGCVPNQDATVHRENDRFWLAPLEARNKLPSRTGWTRELLHSFAVPT